MQIWKLGGITLLFLAVGAAALAQQQAPEINAGSAGSALALLSGALLMIRARRKK
jgi:hypothetical protein